MKASFFRLPYLRTSIWSRAYWLCELATIIRFVISFVICVAAMIFLDATTHLYKPLCLSVPPSLRPNQWDPEHLHCIDCNRLHCCTPAVLVFLLRKSRNPKTRLNLFICLLICSFIHSSIHSPIGSRIQPHCFWLKLVQEDCLLYHI